MCDWRRGASRSSRPSTRNPRSRDSRRWQQGVLATHNANEGTSNARVEAAEAKARNAMFEILLKSKADDADKATGLARENKSADERNERERREWMRDDDTRRRNAEG